MKPTVHLLFLTILFSSCDTTETHEFTLFGEAQGTTYSIKYWGDSVANYQQEIDSLFKEIDASLSTYIDSSTISRINLNDSINNPDRLFIDVFLRSKEINEVTKGAFDPTVKPLVDAWGFGSKMVDSMSNTLVDSLLKFVNLNFFQLSVKDSSSYMLKLNSQAQLDFNGIAQGYSVDVISDFLLSKNLINHLVEIGGEVITKGRNSKGEKWKVGVDKPVAERQKGKLQAIVKLENKALATSGSYRKFYIRNGKKYSHTIDPNTGYPVDHNLLSATVVADDCMSADAFATAFMVFGVNKTIDFISTHKELNLEIYLIYVNNSGALTTHISEGLKDNLEEQD